MRSLSLLFLLAVAVPASAQPVTPEPADSPQARATLRALHRSDPAAYATVRATERDAREAAREAEHAARAAERSERAARPVTVASPLPLPVASRAGGAPLGGACAAGAACTLRADAPPGKAIVVTAVWGASAVRCDGVALATPPGGAPIAPWWRCEKDLVIEGPGAGYAAFAADR